MARVSGLIMLSATGIALLWLFVGVAVTGSVGSGARVFWIPGPSAIACAIAGVWIDGQGE